MLPQPLPFADLYGRFADSWRVTAANSLFDYAPGESTDTFTDSTFPRLAVTLDMLPAELVAQATALVDEAGITDPTVRAAAILDLALTGDLSFLASAAIPVEPKATVEVIDTPAPLPILSVAALDAEQAEGDDGLTLFHFDVFRTGSTAGALDVTYQVVNSGLHSADAVDFGGAMPNGTVHFDDGQTKASITLAVIGDVALEYNESFALKIGVAEADKANVLIAAPSAGATIVNDDGDLPGLLAIRAVTGTASEGNSGITVFSFEVVRSESTLAEARVDYIVQGIGDHPATGDDFADGIYPGGTLIFMPGETRQTIILNIAGDTAIEPDEDFTVMLVNPVNVTLNVTMAGGTIVNDDVPPPPELSIAALDAVKAEGDSGTTAFTFKVTRTGDLNGETSVHFGVSGAVDGLDFAGGALPSGMLMFAPGSAEQIIAFEVVGDTTLEPDEHFTVTLTDPNNATLGTAAAIGTIVNDDVPPPPAFRIMAVDADRPEGDLGPTTFTFTVTRAGDTSVATTMDYTVNGVGPHAVDSNDFGGIFPSGTLSFAPGQNEQTLTIEVNGDTTVEPDEAFAVTLTNPQNGILEVAMAGGTIRNDDVLPPPELSIAALDAVKAEGDSGTTAFTFKVTRTGDLNGETSVHFGVSGTVDGFDFAGGALPSGTLVFAPGSGEQLLTLQVVGDTRVEPHEAFTLTLTEPTNGSLATASAQGIIVNDDHFSIHIGDAPVRPPKSDAGAWERSWTDSHVDISHKANLSDDNEAYSNVLFASSGSGVLNGGDISGGDLGVSGQTLATSAVKQEIDGTEGLRFSLDQEATGISFSLSRFFANDDGTGLSEAGRVQFFNLDQEIVKDVQFYASNAGGEKQMNIDVSEGFVEALFSAGASDGQNFVFGAYGNAAGDGYGGASSAGHGSDYLVDAVTFEFGEVAVIGSILPNNPIDPFIV